MMGMRVGGVSMRTRAFRRHQTERHMWRRLKEDWNEHYDRPNYIDGQWVCAGKVEHKGFYADMTSWGWEGRSPAPSCMCFTEPKMMARFKEQPQTRSETHWRKPLSGRWGKSRQELRAFSGYRLTHYERQAFQNSLDVFDAELEPS